MTFLSLTHQTHHVTWFELILNSNWSFLFFFLDHLNQSNTSYLIFQLPYFVFFVQTCITVFHIIIKWFLALFVTSASMSLDCRFPFLGRNFWTYVLRWLPSNNNSALVSHMQCWVWITWSRSKMIRTHTGIIIWMPKFSTLASAAYVSSPDVSGIFVAGFFWEC